MWSYLPVHLGAEVDDIGLGAIEFTALDVQDLHVVGHELEVERGIPVQAGGKIVLLAALDILVVQIKRAVARCDLPGTDPALANHPPGLGILKFSFLEFIPPRFARENPAAIHIPAGEAHVRLAGQLPVDVGEEILALQREGAVDGEGFYPVAGYRTGIKLAGVDQPLSTNIRLGLLAKLHKVVARVKPGA